MDAPRAEVRMLYEEAIGSRGMWRSERERERVETERVEREEPTQQADQVERQQAGQAEQQQQQQQELTQQADLWQADQNVICKMAG